MSPTLPLGTFTLRTKKIHALIKPLGGSASGAKFLAEKRKISEQEIARRIERLK